MEPGKAARWTIVAGLLAATVGIGIGWAAGNQFRTVIPPGIIILPIIAALVASKRWPWTPVLAVVVALYIMTGVIANNGASALAGHRGFGIAVGRWLQLIGLLITMGAGVRWIVQHIGAIQRQKFLTITGLLLGAPLCAEYLQAYMAVDFVSLLGGILFFAPLYGGAALLIREVAVRTGRGWVGILLLAGAFGLLMPGVIDLAMFGEQRGDIPYWNDLRSPTLIPALGFSAHPMTTWVLGHVVMSIGTPLALLDGLAPALRGRPLLRWWVMLLLVVLFVMTAWFVHLDGRALYGYVPSRAQLLSVSGVVVLLALIAFSPIGRPLSARPRRWIPGWKLTFVVGFVGLVIFGLGPPNWVGVAWMWAVILAVSATVLWFAYAPAWGLAQTTGLACGALTAQTLMGFLAPVPEGMEPIFKYTIQFVFLVLVLIICNRARKTSQAPLPANQGVEQG